MAIGIGWGMLKKKITEARGPAALIAQDRAETKKNLQGAGIGLEHPQFNKAVDSLTMLDYYYNMLRPKGGSLSKGFQSKGKAYKGLLTKAV